MPRTEDPNVPARPKHTKIKSFHFIVPRFPSINRFRSSLSLSPDFDITFVAILSLGRLLYLLAPHRPYFALLYTFLLDYRFLNFSDCQ